MLRHKLPLLVNHRKQHLDGVYTMLQSGMERIGRNSKQQQRVVLMVVIIIKLVLVHQMLHFNSLVRHHITTVQQATIDRLEHFVSIMVQIGVNVLL